MKEYQSLSHNEMGLQISRSVYTEAKEEADFRGAASAVGGDTPRASEAQGIEDCRRAHWTNPEEYERRRFFFCQLEAAETLIWLTEAPAAEKVGIAVPSDGGDFTRLCAKMATGTGKTVVMAMMIAWQWLNKATYPQDTRFSKNVLVG